MFNNDDDIFYAGALTPPLSSAPMTFISEDDLASQRNTFTFTSLPDASEILKLDNKGFHYKGKVIEDAGEAYNLFMKFIGQSK